MNSYIEQPEYLRSYSARKDRQGHLMLRTPLRVAIFTAALAGLALLAIVLHLAAPEETPISPLDRDVPTIEL